MARFRSRVGRWPFSVPDERERADRSQDDRCIAKAPREGWSALQWGDIAAGAQTERRGGAGPVGGLLGGKDPTGRLRFYSNPLSSRPTPVRRTAHGNVTT